MLSEEEKQSSQLAGSCDIGIPWFKRWEEKDTTPPDSVFIARLEELEYK